MRMMTRLLCFALVCAGTLTGCSEPPPSSEDASVPCLRSRMCGDSCCEKGQVCVSETCCTPTPCEGRACGSDGCGTSCGACPSGQACDEAAGVCLPCVRETKDEFCSRLAGAGKVCGEIADKDNCSGERRAEDCGDCLEGKACSSENKCVEACEPETREAFCARLAAAGKVCGEVAELDNCTGLSRREECGDCPADHECTQINTCVPTSCEPESKAQFCSRLQKECGSVIALDNCEAQREEDCGICFSGTCEDNLCVSCVYEEPQDFCQRMATFENKECGVVVGQDHCGNDRSEDCGTGNCAAEEVCDHRTNRCGVCTQESETEFCARMAAAGKVCGLVTGDDNCTGLDRLVYCRYHCANGAVCQNNQCVGAAGDCNDPVVLQPAQYNPNRFLARGDTSLGASTLQGTCAADSSGKELVYRIAVGGTEPRRLVASVVAVFSPVLYLRSACDGPADQTCRAGSEVRSSIRAVVAPGNYYLVVDGASGAEGTFDLEVELGPVDPVPANDTCATAQDLGAFTAWEPGDYHFGDFRVEVAGATTAGANDDTAGSCSPSVGAGEPGDPEVVYKFNVPAGQTADVEVTVAPVLDAVGLWPVAYLRRDCADASSASEVGCAVMNPDNIILFSANQLAAGDYFVVVDGAAGTAGAFDLSIVARTSE
mgnify:FL=1